MDLKDKKVVFLGDSITEGWGTTSEGNIFHQIIKRKLELEMACNCGIGGTRIAKKKIPTYDATKFDLYFSLRLETMPRDADIVVVFGGTNDSGHGDAILGDIDSTDDYTFNGALNNLITKLKEYYPNKPIIFLTPLHRAYEEICMNGTGLILKDYVNAIIEAAKRHDVILFDLFNELDLNPNDPNIVPDGLHPNDLGHEILAKYLIDKFLSL